MTNNVVIKLNIDEQAYNYAKIYSSLIVDEYQRKRAYASITALYAFLNLVEKTPFNIQKSMTLFRNPKVNEQYEITDFYINNWHLDVRVVTGGNAVLIPKVHAEFEIVPDFYVVVKVDAELKSAELLGIADVKNCQTEPFDYNYQAIRLSNLISYEEFLDKVKSAKVQNHSEADHALFRENYLRFMDGDIGQQTKIMFLKHLFECSECRTEFCCFTGFEMVCCNASSYPELLNDETLNIIGAQKVDDKQYEGKEETVYIGNTEENDNNSDNVSQAASDNLDDLFDDLSDELSSTEPIKEQSSEIVEDIETVNSISQISDLSSKIVENIDSSEHINPIDKIENNVASSEPILDTSSEKVQDIENNESDNIIEEIKEEIPSTEHIDDNVNKIVEQDDESETIPYPEESQEETVSDILDELFGDDDILVEDTKSDDKPVVTPLPQQSFVSSDILDDTNILDSQSDDLEIITSDDLVTSEVDDIITESEEGDLVTLEENSELEFIDSDEDDTITDYSAIPNEPEATPTSIDTTVQKVIVDYDETGEPIYSYITSIEPEEEYSVDADNYDVIDSTGEEIEIDDIPSPSFTADNSNIDDTKKDNVGDISEIGDIVEDTISGIEQSNEEIESDVPEQEEHVQADEIPQKEFLDGDILQDDETTVNNLVADDTEEHQPSDNAEVSYDEDSEFEDYQPNEEDGEFENSDDESEEYTDDDDEYLTSEENDGSTKSSSKIVVILISLLLLLGIAGGIGGFMWFKNNHANEQNDNVQQESPENQSQDMFEEPQEENPEEQNNEEQHQEENNGDVNEFFEENPENNERPEEEQNHEGELTEEDLIQPEEKQQSDGNINRAIVNSFAQNRSGVSLRELNWFCTPELFTDRAFKNYLQNLDNTLKQNLRNNLMNATDTPQNDSVGAKFAVDNNGNLQKVIISNSSGSEEIDNIVLQSINESFEGEKSQILNDSALKSDMYYLKVVIKI
ncbi:DUF1822 family protein [bacterium]|nr:DUF1822 family protein [bacterium]